MEKLYIDKHDLLIGKKIGHWSVTKKVSKPSNAKGGGRYYLCKCVCGNEKILSKSSILLYKIKSCGCLPGKKTSALEEGISLKNQLFNRYIKDAKKRGYIFNLPKEIFIELVSSNCYYCGSSPTQVLKNRFSVGKFIYNGVDRIDNSIGYVEGNVVSCCKICNYGKRNLSKEEFLSWIDKIYNHSICPHSSTG